MSRTLLACSLMCLCVNAESRAGHRVVLQGNGRLVILAADGSVEWEKKWGGIHDVHVLENGNLMVQQGPASVVEIDRKTKEVVWKYDSVRSNGNGGKKVEVHAFQPLPDGRVMIAESGAGRIIEVDREGKLLRETKLILDNPHPHTDTRLARKLSHGGYLVCHERDGKVREYNAQGIVVWEYEVPLFERKPRGGHGPDSWGNKCFSAVRLPNGNTLIGTGNGHSVLEVNHHKQIVWKLEQDDLPGIRLAWVTTLEVLPSGNYVIGNCHAGKGQPLLIEVDPRTRKVVWTLDRFDDFGNSVSNSQILGVSGALR